jgi:hypothetical protein
LVKIYFFLLFLMVLPNKMVCTPVKTNYTLRQIKLRQIKLHQIKLHQIKLHQIKLRQIILRQILVLQCLKYTENWADVAIHYKIVWFAFDQLNKIIGIKNWQSPNKPFLCYNTFGSVINYFKNKEWNSYLQTSRIGYQQCMLGQAKRKRVNQTKRPRSCFCVVENTFDTFDPCFVQVRIAQNFCFDNAWKTGLKTGSYYTRTLAVYV